VDVIREIRPVYPLAKRYGMSWTGASVLTKTRTKTKALVVLVVVVVAVVVVAAVV